MVLKDLPTTNGKMEYRPNYQEKYLVTPTGYEHQQVIKKKLQISYTIKENSKY